MPILTTICADCACELPHASSVYEPGRDDYLCPPCAIAGVLKEQEAATAALQQLIAELTEERARARQRLKAQLQELRAMPWPPPPPPKTVAPPALSVTQLQTSVSEAGGREVDGLIIIPREALYDLLNTVGQHA